MASSHDDIPSASKTPPKGRKRKGEDEKGSFVGFVHNVSPIKKGVAGNSYFNFTLQSKEKATRGVCFDSKKRERLSDFAVTKSPVKISNARSKPDIIVDSRSQLAALSPSDMNFEHNPKCADSCIVDLSDISKLATGQLVNVRAEVCQVSEELNMHFNDDPLLKQEVLIRDTKAVIKVILYGEEVGSLDINQSYLLKNLRVKSVNQVSYLNTPKSGEFSYEKIQPIENLVPCHTYDECCMTTIISKIKAVKMIKQSVRCITCARIVNDKGSLIICNHCDSTFLKNAADSFWFVSVLIKDHSSQEQHVVHLSHDRVVDIMNHCDISKDSEECDLVKALLEIPVAFSYTFNVVDRKVQQIKFID